MSSLSKLMNRHIEIATAKREMCLNCLRRQVPQGGLLKAPGAARWHAGGAPWMAAIITEAGRQREVAANGALQAWQVFSEAATNQSYGQTIPLAQATLFGDTGFFPRLRDPPGPFPPPP